MRRLVGLVSTIVVLGLLPGANAQAPPHPGTLGVGDETALYVGEASGQGQHDYTRPSDGCGSHFHFTWSAGKLEKPAFSGGGGFALTRGALANASEQSGSGTYVRNPCGDVAGCSVAMSQDQAVGPGVAEFGADGDSVGVTVYSFGWTDSGACGPDGYTVTSGGEIGSGTFPASEVGSPPEAIRLVARGRGTGRS